PCDVTSKQQVDALADRVVDDLGRADVLINSAGMAYRSPAEDFPEEEFDSIIALNLKGTYLPCQAFGRKLLAQRSGSIVNMASIGAFISYPHASAYNASKGAVLNLTRVLALEWIDRGVRVNGIAPGLCDSPLTRARAKQSSVTSDFLQARMLRKELIVPRELVGAEISREAFVKRMAMLGFSASAIGGMLAAAGKADASAGRAFAGKTVSILIAAEGDDKGVQDKIPYIKKQFGIDVKMTALPV